MFGPRLNKDLRSRSNRTAAYTARSYCDSLLAIEPVDPVYPYVSLPDVAGRTTGGSQTDDGHWRGLETYSVAPCIRRPPRRMADSRAVDADDLTDMTLRQKEVAPKMSDGFALHGGTYQFFTETTVAKIRNLRVRLLLSRNDTSSLFRETHSLHLIRTAIGRNLFTSGRIS